MSTSYSPSLIYSNPTLYHMLMRMLYGGNFGARYKAIAAEIPDGAQVTDLCAGDCYLYRGYLRDKAIRYLGLDLSPKMVGWVRQHGIEAREFNVWRDEVPPTEIAVMQASLCQFIPHAATVVQKMLSAASHKVIIAEPVRNFTSSQNPVLAVLGRRLTEPTSDAKTAYAAKRFDESSLTKLFHSFKAFDHAFLIPGGREMVGVFKGQRKG